MNSDMNLLNNILKEFSQFGDDISLRWVKCFLIVAHHEGLTINEIAERLDANKTTTSRIVDGLAAHKRSGAPYGWLYKRDSKEDKRHSQVFLTKAGRTLVTTLKHHMLLRSI